MNEAKCQTCFVVPDVMNVQQILEFIVIIMSCLKLKDLRVGEHPFHQVDKPPSLVVLSNKSIQCQLNACYSEALG